jgi:sensor histidine kinase regulating citrate/malate metabolism
LIYAENNELVPNITESSALKLLKYIKNVYSNNEVSRNKIIVIDETATDGTIETDESLLIRVLGNMLKNALEAGSINSKVILSSSVENGSITFSVHNDSYIQRNVQLQIFKRSFSTKGLGRGLGTYSMKLLSEKYLRGEVWFESDEDEGTVFYGKYPCKYHTSS